MAAVIAGLALAAGQAFAAGELHIYNWGNYTSPELIEKFEKAHNVKVTLDGYDSNETMLAKIKAGAAGYDIVVPGDYMVQIMISEGLLARTDPSAMATFIGIRAASTRCRGCGARPPLRSTQRSTTATSTPWRSCSIRRTC
jgi:spermidine/putrescine transport system substrate-binding protein